MCHRSLSVFGLTILLRGTERHCRPIPCCLHLYAALRISSVPGHLYFHYNVNTLFLAALQVVVN